MTIVHSILDYLRRVTNRRRIEDELDEEVRAYFEILVDRFVTEGISPREALRRVRARFEGPAQIKERVREARVGNNFDTTLQDIRYGVRALARNPGFTFFAVLTIALGLGANTAIFTLVDGVLLKSSGYPEPERIVQIWEKPPRGLRNGITAANYIDWTRQAKSFEYMAAQSGGGVSYSGGGEPKSLRAAFVSAPYFDVFGIKPSLGRSFAPGEDQRGKEKVAILTHRLWLSQFGGDPSLLNREIRLNGESYTVIGVLPGTSNFDRGFVEIFLPLAFPAEVNRNYHYLRSYARLKPGVSVEQAQAEMSAIAAGIAQQYPDLKKDWGATVDRLLDRIVGPQLHTSLIVLMCAVAAVLLIGCANLANLFLARATLRSREIALRMALGASRGRMIRLLLTESLLLSAGGGVVGIALGFGLLKWIQSLLPPFFLPAESNVALDWRVLLFISAITVLTSVAFGLAPALQASRRQSADSLREGARGASTSKAKIIARHAFVTAQVAIAFILLVGGGLLIRSFQRLMDIDTGYDTENLVSAGLPLANERKPDGVQLRQYITQLLDEIRSEPGVQNAAVATGTPLNGWGDGMPFFLADRPTERVLTGFKIVTPSYFQTLGLRLMSGRFLEERDGPGAPGVVIANESFVRRFFPDRNPLGERILVERILPDRRSLGAQVSWEIVGVVADEKGSGLEAATDIGVYGAYAQSPVVGLGIVARGTGGEGAITKSMQRAIWRVNKEQVLNNPRVVERIKSDSLMSRRLPAMLLGGFSFLAMLLACAGIYGVLSFVTARRTQELGIRAALGATRGDLLRLVAAGGSIPVFIGIGIGLAGAIALARFIQSMLFGMNAIDIPTLAGVAALFLFVAMLACLVPAWRAARIDPMIALRQE